MREKELYKLFDASTSLKEINEVKIEYDKSYKRFFSYKEVLAFILTKQ